MWKAEIQNFEFGLWGGVGFLTSLNNVRGDPDDGDLLDCGGGWGPRSWERGYGEGDGWKPSLLGVSELKAAHGFGGLGEVGDPFFELGMLGVLADEFDEIGGGWGGVDALVEEVQ